MYSFVALVALIGVASASKCCIPPQWEANTNVLTTIVHNGRPVVSTSSVATAYDGVNKIIGQYEYINFGDVERKYGVLMDFKSNMKYMVDEKGMCYKSSLNRAVSDFGGCIPDNATMVSDGEVVGLGTNSIKLNSYRMDYGSVVAYIGVTAENCIPAMETIRGDIDGNSFIQNIQYFNISGGISNPANLQVPPVGCENAPMFESHYTGGNFLSETFGRRSVLLGL